MTAAVVYVELSSLKKKKYNKKHALMLILMSYVISYFLHASSNKSEGCA